MRRTGQLAALAVLALATEAAARAQAFMPTRHREPGAFVHDGFYLRFELGLGGAVFTSGDPDLRFYGFSGTFGVAAGGAVAPNVILFLEVFDDVIPQAKFSSGHFQLVSNNSEIGQVSLGGGVAYYFMPVNIYVSGALAASRLSSNQNQDVIVSDWGVGVSLLVGKEWWVSENWGIGVALHAYGGRVGDRVLLDGAPTSVTWTLAAFEVAFSATYN